MSSIRIDGLQDCIRWADNLPANALKLSQKGMREASKVTARQIRQKSPKRWKTLVKYKVFKGTVTGDTNALIGYYNRTPGRGREVSDWFKAYWANYGTLTKRDPSHHFDTAIKGSVRGRRNNVGQDAEKFFEAASEGWEDTFMTAFDKALKDNEQLLNDR